MTVILSVTGQGQDMLITKLERRIEDAAVSLPIGFEKGQVFTPRFLATWVAVQLKEHLGEQWSGNLLDPACGDGELLDGVRLHKGT